MQRCRDKAQFKYKDKNGEISWHRLTDIVRDTIVYQNLDDMYKGLRAIHEDREMDIIECNDRYMNPLDGGYRDIQLILRIEGMVCELQLNTKWMQHVKENAGHRAFEVSREVMAAVGEPDAVERCRNILQWGKEMLNDDKKGLLHKAAKEGNAHLVSIFLAFRAVGIPCTKPWRMATSGRCGPFSVLARTSKLEIGTTRRGGWGKTSQADERFFSIYGCLLEVPLLDGLLKNREATKAACVARLVSVAVQCTEGGLEQLREAKDGLGDAVKKRLVMRPDLIAACVDGNLPKLKQLLAEWADPNSASTAKDGHAPLHAVLLRPKGLQPVHLDIVRALVDMDADLTLPTTMSAGETVRTFTLLHSVLHSKSGKALKILAAAGLPHDGKLLSEVLDAERRVGLLDESLVSVGEMLEMGATPAQIKALHKKAGLETPEEFLQQVVLKGFGPKELGRLLRKEPRFLTPTLPLPAFDAVRKALQEAPADLRNDRDIILACIRHDAACLVDAPEALRSERSFLLDAVQQNPRVLEFAPHCREDRDFVADAMRLQPAVLEFAGSWRSDRELALEAVQRAPWVLDLLDDQLQNDPALAFEATQVLARWGTRTLDFVRMAELRRVSHDSEVLCTCVTAHNCVAAGCEDGNIVLHDLSGLSETDESPWKLQGHKLNVNCLCMLSEAILASGSADHTVRIWNLHTKEALHVLEGHTYPVLGLVRLSATQPASGSADTTIRLWSLTQPADCRVFVGHTGFVRCCCLTTAGSLVSGSDDETLRVWRPENGEALQVLRGHTGRVFCLCQSSAELLASCSDDKTVRLWHLTTWTAMRVLEGLTTAALSLCLLAPSHLAAGDRTGRLLVWSVTSGEMVHEIQNAHSKEIGALMMTKVDGEHMLCSGCLDSTLKLWQLQARP
ncbi:unnamed protein product [Symbiodinium sp. CCMP2456]|nr:unnamed protein product [Symbiodinium sp. CCMP2456]